MVPAHSPEPPQPIITFSFYHKDRKKLRYQGDEVWDIRAFIKGNFHEVISFFGIVRGCRGRRSSLIKINQVNE